MKGRNHPGGIELTADQNTALEKINVFLNSSENIFLLKGYAGTGKTTLLKIVASNLRKQGVEPVLLAPTGRAAMILREKTGELAFTIHKGIYNFKDLKEKWEGNSFKFVFDLNVNHAPVNSVYLIDEASMISNIYSEDEFFIFGSGLLLKDLTTYALYGNNQRKMIFIGDTAQLPPVGMTHSPALDPLEFENLGLDVVSYEMKAVIRQDIESGILKNATKLRDAIRNNNFSTFKLDETSVDCVSIPLEKGIPLYAKLIEKEGLHSSVILTHTNNTALQYCKIYRRLRFNTDDLLVAGELLMIVKNNYNLEVELFNGMFCKVMILGSQSRRKLVSFLGKGKTHHQVELIFREAQIEVETLEGKKQLLWVQLLENFIDYDRGKLDPIVQRALYIDFKTRMANINIRPGTEEFIMKIRNDIWFNALQVKYGYAITCHKAQGGEWKHTIVDMQAMIGKNSIGYFRWAYTAITRASSCLYTIGAPAFHNLTAFVIQSVRKLSKIPDNSTYIPENRDDPSFFIRHRIEKIENLCFAKGIGFSYEIKSYHIILSFSDAYDIYLVKLHFNKTGFTTHENISGGSVEFRSLIKNILLSSLIPASIPHTPRNAVMSEIYNHLLSILRDENIQLMNIVAFDWCDRYFVQTDAEAAFIDFLFNAKGILTKVQPASTLGSEDTKLNLIIDHINGLR